MPIEPNMRIVVIDQAEFHELAFRALRVIFDVHNTFGRLLDELLFKREVAARCEETGLGRVLRERQAAIRVTHRDFVRDFFLDLLFNSRLMIEAKAAENIAPAHRAQALNYLLLTGMQHGLLVNVRPERVQHEYISTQLTDARRRQFRVIDDEWVSVNEESVWLRKQVVELVEDWGAFLEVTLYRDAVVHFLGGQDRVVRPVPVFSDRRLLGEQPVHLLTGDTAISFTAITADASSMRDHQLRFLNHTALKCIQWINFNHHQIEFRTLRNGKMM